LQRNGIEEVGTDLGEANVLAGADNSVSLASDCSGE